MIDDLRSQLRALEDWGELQRISRRVDARFELPAISKKLEADRCLLFENVKRYSMPVVVGADNSRPRIARVLGTDEFHLTGRYLEAIRNPLPPLTAAEAPVKDVKITKDINIGKELPVITHYEKDGGPFITAGIVIAEDKAKGVRNVSYHRLQVLAPDEIGIFIQPRHLWSLYQEREKEGKGLEIAIAIGLDAAVRLAGATSGSIIPLGYDELSIAGALRQKPVEIVSGETVDIMVPARAEIVIEGEILPHRRSLQGPLTHYAGGYGDPWEGPVIKVRAITHRKNPIYQDLLPFTPEHHLLLAVPYEPVLYETVRARVPGTKAVHIPPSGCGKFHAVVSVQKEDEEDGKKAASAVLSGSRDIKLVTVVDDDVNPYDPRDVEWAVATRFQADRDLVVVSGVKGNELDPSSSPPGTTAKMGLDATKKSGDRDRFEKACIPGIERFRAEDYLGR